MRSGTIVFGIVMTLGLMLAALWGWQHATMVVEEWNRPDVAANAVRCAAVALAAGAQVVLFGCVIGRVYKTKVAGRFEVAYGMTAAAVCTIAIVSAVTLAIAGR